MAGKKLNVLVYSGTGSTIESVRHCIYSLRRLLSPNYAVLPITGDTLLKEPWMSTCALLVFPGGADLGYCRTLNGEGNRKIRGYVSSGGRYLGLCAGGYYGSRRCEFEIGDPAMEVAGERELDFFPGICRGAAFSGFRYGSEAGTHAAELQINKTAFASVGVLPEVLRCYFNGGSVFVNAASYESLGVEVLASYTEKLDVQSEGSAAVVCCNVGEGRAVLTGPHPEFSAEILSKNATGMRPGVYDALIADDKSRLAFFRACLLKLGLQVNEQEQHTPTLTPIHISSSQPSTVSAVLALLQPKIKQIDGADYLAGENDTFRISNPQSTWSFAELTKAALETLSTAPNPSITSPPPSNPTNQPPDQIVDYTEIVKALIPHETDMPTPTTTPNFNHQTYYAALASYYAATPPHLLPPDQRTTGTHLMYGEVVTSTSTLLEKNPSLTANLPTGTTLTATSQLSGRGRGSNVWLSPAGSLMFSTVLRHPLALNATAPVVFIQYLAALAVAEGVQSYGADGHAGAAAAAAYRRLPIRLKWPNDIYALDPSRGPHADAADSASYVKVGGILVNSSYAGGDYTLVLGIGLNASNAAPTTSLDALLAAHAAGSAAPPFSPERLLARILTKYAELYAIFLREGFGGELERLYYRHWLHSGQVVTLETEGGARARIKGITTDWGLLLAEELASPNDRATGRTFALQTDSNSFDFFRGLLKRKV